MQHIINFQATFRLEDEDRWEATDDKGDRFVVRQVTVSNSTNQGGPPYYAITGQHVKKDGTLGSTDRRASFTGSKAFAQSGVPEDVARHIADVMGKVHLPYN